MRKFWAIACTLAFSAFWVFGGLSVLALVDGHPLAWVVMVLAALGLGLGVLARLQVVALTQDVPVGERATQQDSAHA